MHRRIAPLVGLVALCSVLAVWLVAVPLVSAGNPCFHGFTMPSPSRGTDAQIKLAPCAFAPTVTSVAVGSTVTFYNGPGFTHLITGANQAWGSPDVEVQPNRTVAYVFDKAGTYPYACALHPGMSGVIVVGDATTGAAAAAGANTTSGGGTTAVAAQQPTPAAASPADAPGLVAISAAAGALVGAVVVWVSVRRRAVRRDEPAAGIA
jgi:plastocyanin